MKREKGIVKAAAILLFVNSGIIAFLFSLILFIDNSEFELWQLIVLSIIAIPLAMGIALLRAIKDDEVFIKKRNLLLGMAILSIFQNIISAILLFVAYDDLGRIIKNNSFNKEEKQIKNETKPEKVMVEKPKKEKVSPELRKIDILAKLGVGLVVLSGIILSTSENNLFASNISKPIMMALLFGLFRVLYHVFDKKIVIKSSSILYYYLSHVFFVLVFISIGYFEIFGYDLSFFGGCSKLMYAIVLLSFAFSVATINNRFPRILLGEVAFLSVIAALVLTMSQFELESTHIYGILLIITMFLYMNKEKLNKCIINANDLVFALISIISLLTFLVNEDLVVFELLLSIYVVVLLRQRVVTNDRWSSVARWIIPIITNIIILMTIVHASTDCSLGTNSELFITPTVFNYRLIAIISLLISGGLFIRGKDKETVYSGIFSSLILSLIISLTMNSYEYSMVGVLASIIIFSYVTVILKIAQKKPIRSLCFITQFISLLLFSISGVLFYINNGINATLDTTIYVYIIFVTILNMFEKNVFNEYKIQSTIYYITIIGLLGLNVLFMTEHGIIYNALMIALLFAYRKHSSIHEDNKFMFNYLFVLCVYLNVFNILITYTTVMVTNLIMLIGLLVFAYYSSEDKKISFLSIMFAYIPYLYLIGELDLELVQFDLLTRIPLIILTFILSRKLLDLNNKTANELEIVLLGAVFVSYMFEVNVALGISTFLIALIMIYIGFRFEKYNSLFIVGIGVTILNIIVQLSDFWASVPLPVYLLLSGLAIIGYVTYKEITKNKVKEEKKEVKVEEPTRTVDSKSNTYIVVLIVVSLISIIFIARSSVVQEENRRRYDAYIDLSNKGIDTSKIRIDDNNRIYILEGNHYDVKTIIDAYRDKDDYDYYEYDVCYVDKTHFNKINHRDYDYYVYRDYGNSRCFGFYNDVVKEKNLGNVKIKVRNETINYLTAYDDNRYDYNSLMKYGISMTYNTYDVDALELYFENVGDNEIVVETAEDTISVTKDGLYKFKSSTGIIELSMQNKEYLPSYYNNQGNSYNNGNYYYNGY